MPLSRLLHGAAHSQRTVRSSFPAVSWRRCPGFGGRDTGAHSACLAVRLNASPRDGDEGQDVEVSSFPTLDGVNTAEEAAGRLSAAGSSLSEVVARLASHTRLPESLVPPLLALPSTASGMEAIDAAAEGLLSWRSHLQRGLLPPEEVEWPRDAVFRSAVLGVFADLDMARFTRRHPALLDTVLANVLDLLAKYEANRKEVVGPDAEGGDTEQERSSGQKESSGSGDVSSGQSIDDGQEPQNGSGGGGGEPGEGEPRPGEGGGQQGADEAMLEAMEKAMSGADFSMSQSEQPPQQGTDAAAAAREANEALAQSLMKEFKQEWDPLTQHVDAATKAFDGFDLKDLSEGRRGFDSSAGIWHATGWQELDALRAKLQRLRELRDLVRSLGRGGGRGPRRRAPRQIERSRAHAGLVRSEEAPEETRGLTRSDDLSRMLPNESTLLAASRRGIPAARLLHFARRAERTLLSYERVGWVDMPAVTTHGTEIRPAADCGPILVCLDTSGSMAGARETVAKALTLECMRQARTQRRGCYAYAFSGPGQCVEFELSFTAKGMADLLQFLAGSFHGGTDVDEPLKRSLERLQGHPEWANADVLLVTDGEIPPPSEELLASLSRATQDMGLKVHGLLVGEEHGTEAPVRKLCTHVTQFTAWDNVRDASRSGR